MPIGLIPMWLPRTTLSSVWKPMICTPFTCEAIQLPSTTLPFETSITLTPEPFCSPIWFGASMYFVS